MALVKCGECESEVSDKAAACPKCGAPVASPDGDSTVVTTQQTAKVYKAHQLYAFGLIVVGLFVAASGSDGTVTLGAGAALIGLIWLIWARVAAWWDHG